MAKYIFITGGVVSSLGKGVTAASVGQILKSRGLKVFMQKFDPYINVDPGNISPYEHGEVFVTTDGAETDLDLGHYERFIDENLSKYSSVSTGKIYKTVIEKEREGLYDGATIQVIPHITDEIKQRLHDAANYSNADIIITEIGGTVGDIESLPYLEAIRQARRDFGYKNTLYIHNTLVPYLKAAKEIKTKPTQHSVSELKSLGIQPDLLVLRSEVAVSQSTKEKISAFTDIEPEGVFESIDVDVIYQTILNMRDQKIDDYILKHFKMDNLPLPNLDRWSNLVDQIRNLKETVKIALVGKYVSLHDAYISVVESLKHSGYHHNVDIDIKWIDAATVTKENVEELLGDCDGVLIPGGFGKRATSGKIQAIKYARENDLVTLGICYGHQLMLVEYAKNVLNITDANSTEIDPNTNSPIIIKHSNNQTRVGSYETHILENTKLHNIYRETLIEERYRNSYHFNSNFANEFIKEGNLLFSANVNNNETLAALELKNKKWFIGIQAHPEFLSRPLRSHPLFNSFIENAKLSKAK